MLWIADENKQLKQLLVSQPLYTECILRRFGMTKSKPLFTPRIKSSWTDTQSESDKSVVTEQPYQQIIDPILYFALQTRFKILPAVSVFSRSQRGTTAYFHQSGEHVLWYLRRTSGFCIIFYRESLQLDAFVDLYHDGDENNRKSMTKFFVNLWCAPCSWASEM